MDGLMMDFPLTLNAILRRAETIFGGREIASQLVDKSWHRYTYADMTCRAKCLALALTGLGVERGDRVATLCLNHHAHLEAYFGVPACGAVLHTLNFRLHADDLAYIVNEAKDRVIIVDESLLPVLESFRDRIEPERIVVIADPDGGSHDELDYETLLSDVDSADFCCDDPDEQQAASMCYTSGTSGRPKGVTYSHRALVLHTLVGAMSNGFGITESDCMLPVVPMFHVNGWGLPYIAAIVGAKIVFTGRHVDSESLLDAYEKEQVTITAGVPSIWFDLLARLDDEPGRYDLSPMRSMIVGGAAMPKSMLEGFQERHNLHLVHAWGMTETTPLGTICHLRHGQDSKPAEQQYEHRLRQGTPAAFVEIRARGEEGIVPWDGESLGELEIRGPWVAKSYYQRADASDRFTADGWLRTGDIVAIDERGSMKIADRAKDLIKSGGEWISSLDLESAILTHPAVAQAAVIAVPHPKWNERPLAVVVRREGHTVTEGELREHIESKVASWWLPDAFRFVDDLPKTSVGKIRKTALREQFSTAEPQ